MHNRIEFKQAIKERLFKQAGGRCSVPRCINPTMGPYYTEEGVINLGMACHIYSAAENGPRGRGGNDDEFIGSERNGIWCCRYHGDLIDKRNGSDYPAGVLFAWKKLAEARVLKQMIDKPSPLGWVESIEFTEFMKSTSPPRATLSRNTIIFGDNRTGKSSLVEVAGAVSDSIYGERFKGIRSVDKNGERPIKIAARVIYSTVDSLSKQIDIEICGKTFTRYENGVPSLLTPGDLEVIVCSSRTAHIRPEEDHIDFLKRYLNVDESAVMAIVKLGARPLLDGQIRFVQATKPQKDDEDKIENIYKDNGEPYMELEILQEYDYDQHWVDFDNLSGSEQARLLAGLLIIKAKEVSKQRLTLLLIDGVGLTLDTGNFKHLLNTLSTADFQTAIVLPPYREGDILEKDSSGVKLKKLDYLKPWKLVVLERPT